MNITSKDEFKPGCSALLVIDMQRYFLDRASHAYIPYAEPILPVIRELMESYFQNDLPVIVTRHLNTDENANLMNIWWNDVITESDPLSEIHPELTHPRAQVLEKSQYDAFYKTSLEGLLREQGTSQVVITGVMTHLCCETTARSAFVRGFEVFFVQDATATSNEHHHQATLMNLAHGFVHIVSGKEIVEHLRDPT